MTKETTAGHARRKAARTSAIISATYELLRDVGYEQLTIEAVAARAGAGKATIYRRWPDKRSLVCDALLNLQEAAFNLPNGAGSLREDLLTLVTLDIPGDAPGFANLLATARRDPVISQALDRGAFDPQRQNCRTVVERAISRGELKDPALAEVLFELILGRELVRHIVVHGRTFPFDTHREFVETVLLPVLTSHP